MKLSVIIPAYKEPYLQKTIDSLLETSGLDSDMEIIPVWDGPKYRFPIKEDSRVKVVQLRKRWGMRACINAGLAEAKGGFVAKVDAHCVFNAGFAEQMVASCQQDNWLVIPSRYHLDETSWQINRKWSGIEYHYLYHEQPNESGQVSMGILNWHKKSPDRIDDTFAFQGSCWLADRKYFMDKVGFLDDSPETYGSFVGEAIEVGLKYWLNGGEVKVSKDIEYGHLDKRRHHYMTRIFSKSLKHTWSHVNQHTWVAKHWRNDEEPNMKHSFSWLLEKFWPVPGWPEDRDMWRVRV